MNSPSGKDELAFPWLVDFSSGDRIHILTANGVELASAHFQSDLNAWSITGDKLSPAETEQIAKVLDRLPASFKR